MRLNVLSVIDKRVQHMNIFQYDDDDDDMGFDEDDEEEE